MSNGYELAAREKKAQVRWMCRPCHLALHQLGESVQAAA